MGVRREFAKALQRQTGQASVEGHAWGEGASLPRSQGGVVGAAACLLVALATSVAGTLPPGEEWTLGGEGRGSPALGARGVASAGE